MNSSEMQLVEKTIKGLMNPNNEERKISEQQLEQLMTNKPALIFLLSQLLIASTSDQASLTYAAVMMRKLLEVKENEIVSSVWTEIAPDVQEQIKSNVYTALAGCTVKPLKKKYADVTIALSENIFQSNSKWDEALKYIIQGFSIDLIEQNQVIIENCVYLLGKVFTYAHEQLSEGIEVFTKGFTVFFSKGNLELKTLSVQSICEILNDPENKKQSKKFSSFTFNILETTLACHTQKDDNNLKICLLALGALGHSVPQMLKKSFNDLYILMGKIINEKTSDDTSIYGLSYEILISVVEKYPNVISKENTKIVELIYSIYKYGMKFEATIDDNWLTPKSISLTHEDYIPEENLDEALALIDRILLALKPPTILPILSNVIKDLMINSITDWRLKYIAYVSIGKIADFVDEIKDLEYFIEIIIADMHNDNPKIRYACLFCMHQFSIDFKEDFTNLYNETALPNMIQLLTKDTVLRVKLQICDSLQSFMEKSENNIITQYMQAILDAIFAQFIKSDSECPVSLREIILNTLESLISNNVSEFPKYAEKCFNILAEYLEILIKSTNSSLLNLVGLLIDLLTKVGEHCAPLFKKAALPIAKTLINFQNQIDNFKGEIGDKFVNAWERLIPIIRENNKEIVSEIMQSILKVISKPPEMALSSNPKQKFDIQNFFNDLITSPNKSTLIEKANYNLTINTSETEEYTIFLQLFNLFLKEFKELFIQYVDPAEKEAKRISTYPNINIRSEACKIYPLLLQVIKTQNNHQQTLQYFKQYLSFIIDLIEKENDNEVLRCLFDSLTDLITENDNLLAKEDLYSLFSKLFSLFDKIEVHRIQLVNEESTTETEIVKTAIAKKTKALQQEDDDDFEDCSDNSKLEALDDIQEVMKELEEVLISFTEVIGILFKTHKQSSIDIAQKLFTTLLPKYFNQNATTFEIKMGLFILDDMVEHFNEKLYTFWDDIAKIFLSYIISPLCEIRQAASYGLGEFCKYTTNDHYSKYSKEILQAIQSGFNCPRKDNSENDYGQAQDNITTALGKIIKYQSMNHQLEDIIPLWFNHLPIIYDSSEAVHQHELLCEIIVKQSTYLFRPNNENVPRVIQILCKIVNSKKFSNDTIDQSIATILDQFGHIPTYQPCIALAKKNAEKKVLVKIKKFFP